MNISVQWLNSYLDRPIDADEAGHVLTDIGLALEDQSEFGDDAILDIEVTSNRSDALSHVGVAREIAAATGRKLKAPSCELAEPKDGEDVAKVTSVVNDRLDLCPLYTARVIRGVKVSPSPQWLVRHIEAIGLRAVNNIVDITNFVLHELGQPLHAFDLEKLVENRIVVRTAKDGERFTAIDGSGHKLRDDMLVIADGFNPVAMAGVMGGVASEVNDETTDILLESARFDPLSVRTTSRALKLGSDSSYRFERGVDPYGVDAASRRAAQLIVELAGGKLCKGVISVGKKLPKAISVSLRPERCNALLGYELPAEKMVKLLDGLGLSPQYDGKLITCTIPSHRLDLKREVDLIEEVARLHSYGHIEVQSKIHIVARGPQPEVEARRKIGRVLTAHGYCETITFSFLSPAHAKPFMEEGVELLSVDDDRKKTESALRPSLLPSLLAVRKGNQDAGNENVRLFEAANVFARKDGKHTEARHLALLGDAADVELALRELRGAIEELCASLGREVNIVAADQAVSWAQPAGLIVDANEPGHIVGQLGKATDELHKLFDVQTPVVMAWLDSDWLMGVYPPQPTVKSLSRYPAVERDLSVIVDESIAWAQVSESIEASAPALLEEVQFVTAFRGKPIEAGRKSVTFRMTFRDPSRTLQHNEVDEQVNAVVAKLSKDVKAELRV